MGYGTTTTPGDVPLHLGLPGTGRVASDSLGTLAVVLLTSTLLQEELAEVKSVNEAFDRKTRVRPPALILGIILYDLSFAFPAIRWSVRPSLQDCLYCMPIDALCSMLCPNDVFRRSSRSMPTS